MEIKPISKELKCFFDEVPKELILHIFSLLSPSDLWRCFQVQKSWWSIGQESKHWRILKSTKLHFSSLREDLSPWKYFKSICQLERKLERGWEGQKRLEAQFLELGHLTSISSLDIQEGKAISGDCNGKIAICDLAEKKLLQTIQLEEESISRLVMESQHLFVGSETGNLKILDFTTGQIEKKWSPAHQNEVPILSLSFPLGISADKGGKISLWDFRSGKCEREFNEHLTEITSVHVENGSLLSSDKNGVIKQWNLGNSNSYKTWIGDCLGVNTSEVVGKWLFLGTRGGVIKKFEKESSLKHVYHGDGVCRTVHSLEALGKNLIAHTSALLGTLNARWFDFIEVWNWEGNKFQMTYQIESESIHNVRLWERGIICASQENLVVWDLF